MIDDYKIGGRWKKDGYIGGKQHGTRSFSKWNSMMHRCKEPSKRGWPSYEGCEVSEEFSDFQQFTDWHIAQVGYALENYQLDKDILITGNKVYSPSTCLLVPQALNTLLTHVKANKGEYPTGVNFSKSMGKLVARIRVDNKDTVLGYFESAEEARQAYECAKRLEVLKWCYKIESGEVLVDLKVLPSLHKLTCI